MTALAPLLLVFLSAAGQAGAQTAGDASFGWAAFEPGSYVRLQIKTVTSYGIQANSSSITVRQTLLSKGKDTARLSEAVTGEDGETRTRRIEVPLSASALFAGEKNPRAGKETIKVMGEPLPCFTVQFRGKVSGKKGTTKLWLSSEIPGGVARNFFIADGEDQLISIVEVLSYEAIRPPAGN